MAGGVLLLAIFAYGWFLRWRSLRHEAASERAPPRPPSVWHYVRSLAFLAPLVVGFPLAERGLNALAALQRGAGDHALPMSTPICSKRGDSLFSPNLSCALAALWNWYQCVEVFGACGRQKYLSPRRALSHGHLSMK